MKKKRFPFSLRQGNKKKKEEAEDRLKISIKTWSYPNLRSFKIFEQYRIDYSQIVIGQPLGESNLMYLVIDPKVSPVELAMLENAASKLLYLVDSFESEKELLARLAQMGIRRRELQYLILRELIGYGPLDPVMKDKNIEDVECSGSGKPVTVVHSKYDRLETNIIFESEEELDKYVLKLARMAGKTASLATPIVEGILPGNHRLTATFRREVSESSTFAIRKFPPESWTITRVMLKGSITPEIVAWLWMLIESKLPILIVGEMGSGKTSLSNALCGLIPPNRRIGTVEDRIEFRIPHRNWLRYFTRTSFGLDDKGAIPMARLLKTALSSNVDYLIVNEIRAEEEAKVWIQAVSTGHGGITTFHADSFKSALNRLIDFGLDVSILSALHGLVLTAKLNINGERVRRVREIADFEVEGSEVRFHKVFWHNAADDTFHGLPPEELVKLPSARIIMNFRGYSEDEFIEAYNKRVEFLKWLLEMSRGDARYTKAEKLIEEFEKFYAKDDYYRAIEPPRVEISEEEEEEKEIEVEIGREPRIISVQTIERPATTSAPQVVSVRRITASRPSSAIRVRSVTRRKESVLDRLKRKLRR